MNYAMSAYKDYLLRVWESRLKRFSYSSSTDDRDMRLARIGLLISVAIIGVLGVAEIAFLIELLWDLLR